jgi:anti-sigma B factor antagonist
VTNTGIKERRVGRVTILDTDAKTRIGLRFGGSSVSLSNAIDSLVEEGQNQILLNLEGVVFIDARGLGELVSNHISVSKSGGQFKLFNLSATLLELMKSTKLLNVFDVFENELQAVTSFNGHASATAVKTETDGRKA